jgi:hypothetical protein
MLLAGRSATLAPEESDDAGWIAQRMVLEAGAQAARLRRQASLQTASICEAAELETELIWQRASEQAAAIREASEREAAQLRAVVMRLATAPAGLVNLDRDVASPEVAKPVGRPGTRTSGKPSRRARLLESARRVRPVGLARPRSAPAGKPRPRQYQAMRVATAATAALFSIAVITGAAEIGMHGFKFFVFRETGAGESGPNVPTDQQFLAQQAAEAKATAAKSAAAKPVAVKAAARTTATKPAAHKARTSRRHSAKSSLG